MHWLGCAPTWTVYSNTRMNAGVASSATTVSECLSVCYRNTSCTAVDWLFTESVGRQCWLHGSWSRGSRSSRAGVEHFSISRPNPCNGNHRCCLVYTFMANSVHLIWTTTNSLTVNLSGTMNNAWAYLSHRMPELKTSKYGPFLAHPVYLDDNSSSGLCSTLTHACTACCLHRAIQILLPDSELPPISGTGFSNQKIPVFYKFWPPKLPINLAPFGKPVVFLLF